MDESLRYAIVSLEHRTPGSVKSDLPAGWRIVTRISDFALLIEGPGEPPTWAMEVGPNTAAVLRRRK